MQKKKEINVGWLKYVHIRKLNNNRVENNKIHSFNIPPPKHCLFDTNSLKI